MRLGEPMVGICAYMSKASVQQRVLGNENALP